MKKVRRRKYRLIKWQLLRLLMFFVGIIAVFSCNNVAAGMNDTEIAKNRVNDVYAIGEIDGKTRIFYLNMYTMNGRISYCIELGVDISTSIYHSTGDFSISYLTSEQIDYVRAISYFGYGYEGHDNYLYYLAAQELIWEYLNDVDIYWTREMKVDGEKIEIDFYKNAILSLLNNYNEMLELEVGQAYTVGDEIVIEDKNKVLSDYEVVSSLYSDVSIEGNSLAIKVGNVVAREKIELKRKGYYGYDSQLYYYESSQKLVSNGNYKEQVEKIEFNINGVTLKGRVLEGQVNGLTSHLDSLEGAVYELYSEDGDLIGQYTSDYKGLFEIEDLKYGKYYFKQVKASEGYLVNDEITEVIVDRDNIEVELEQVLITNNFVINKVYGSNGNYKPEKGITFLIFDHYGIWFTQVLTDKDGVASVVLPYGKYKVIQQTTTNGYSKVADFYIEVDEKEDENIYYNLVNELILVDVKINTFDEERNEVLKSSDIAYKVREKGKNTFLEFEGEDIFYADDNGIVSLPIKLDYGNYILEQVNVPDGVLLFEEEVNFSINSNSKLKLIDGSLVMEVDVYNKLIKGNINVKTLKEVYYKDFNKYGYEFDIRNDVELLLKANEDIIVNGEVIYVAGEEVYRGKNDDNGNLIIDNLYLGSYCLIDNDTSEEQCFLIKAIDNKTSVVNVELEFIKYLDKFNLVIENKTNDGLQLDNSLFELIDIDNEIIYTGITNDEGMIKVEDVLLGSYCIKQKEVQEGFYLLNDSVCFLLETDKTLEFVNEKVITKTINVPNTFKEDDIGFYELVVIIALIGTVYVVYKKIFKSKLGR